MKTIKSITCATLCSALLIFQGTGYAAAQGQQQSSNAAPLTPFVLEDGTPVKLRLAQTVSSADAHVNDRVEFEVLEDVTVNNVVIIAKGATALGTVTEAVPKRRMARGGKLEIVMDSVRMVDGEKVALRAVKDGKGGGHTGGMTIGIVAAAIVFWPAAPLFLLMHGKDITMPKGTDVPTFVNGEMKLDQAKFQPNGGSSLSAGMVASNVTISSSPAGADIYVDQNFAGNTPSTLSVPPGKHTISVKKTGFQDWVRDMNLSGGTINLSAELVKGASNTTPVATQPQAQSAVIEQPEMSVAEAARQNRANKTNPQPQQ